MQTVQFHSYSLTQQSGTCERVTPARGVRQDKDLSNFQRIATNQPGPVNTPLRRMAMNNEIDRSKNNHTGHFAAVKASTWVDPRVKDELERKAEAAGISLSKLMSIALAEWVQKDLHFQHDSLLYPLVRKAVHEEMTAFGNRIVFFLMTIAFAAEQSRILIINLLSKFLQSQGEDVKALTKIRDESASRARRNILDKPEYIKTMLEEWEKATPPTGKEEIKYSNA